MHRVSTTRRAAVAAIGLALWWTGLVAPQGVAAATFSDCDNSAVQYPSKVGMARMMRTAGTFDGVLGDQTVRDLHSCSNPNTAASYGRSWALLTLQNADGSRFLQLGYGLADCPTGGSCSVDDNVRHFVYTPSSNTGGVLDEWDDVFFESPQIGDKYRFKIYQGSGEIWYFCIKNVTDGGAYTCLNRDENFTTGEEVWWIFEVSQIEDQMGSSSSTSLAKWDSMQYRHDGSTTWYITTGDSGNCNAAPGGAGDCDTELGEPSLFNRHHATVGHLNAVPPDDESYFWAYSSNDL